MLRAVLSRRGAQTARWRASSVTANVPPVELIKVKIDGREIEVNKKYTVLQACEEAGVDIPRFCYHDRLSIAGNCRMCLVEVVKAPKPVASCAFPLMPNMEIKTDTPMVRKAREGVMEFLLANHPLDCPICDQGGECDLQDQSMVYGSDRGRFNEMKRSVEDKEIGPFIKTIMTRCIHCTRCVRFAEEIAGVPDLGATGRGNTMEIGTYIEKPFDSELSGNAIDICPVGALTSRPFAFTARPWELQKTESIDVHDAMGANIRVDVRGREVLRILPRLHEDINEEWLGDKSRFAYDGLKQQRLDIPMQSDGTELSWSEALTKVADAIRACEGSQLKAIVGDLVDAESQIVVKDLFNRLGSTNVECRQDGAKLSPDFRMDYIMNTTIAGIEDADCLLLVGCNPRMEAPLLNARIRKVAAYGNLKVASIGPAANLTYDHELLGDTTEVINELVSGSHPFMKKLTTAKRPMILVGQAALRNDDGPALLSALKSLSSNVPLFQDDWNGFNVLQQAAGRTAGLDLGLVPGPDADDSDIRFVLLLGADEFDAADVPEGAFVVYIGHHGDKGASRANLILPSAAYTEKSGLYANTEGRSQMTARAVPPIGEAREDWEILRAISEVVDATLPYDTLEQVRARVYAVAPNLQLIDEIVPAIVVQNARQQNSTALLSGIQIPRALENYFFTDPISRSSPNLANAGAQLPQSSNSYVQADLA